MSSARPIPAPAESPRPAAGAADGPLRGIPPEALFIGGALAQYVGASLAVLLFAVVPAAGVAWLRVLAAFAALALWRRPWETRWSPRALGLAGVFGLALAAMNLTFYLAIDRLPLGSAVAIEFCGPIAVATLGSRTRRDAGALALAVAGVALLADLHFSGAPLGVGLALAAGGFWALYIVLGHRLALEPGLRPRDGLAAGMGIGALAFAPFLAASAAPAFAAPWRLGACLLVGLLSSVVPYALDQLAMTRLPRARFALLLSILPASAAIIGAVVLGQLPGVTDLCGIALVVAAAAMRSHVA